MKKKSDDKKHTALQRVVTVIAISLAEFLLVNYLVALGLAPNDKVDPTLSMLLTVVAYFIISGIFLYRNSPVHAFWTAIVAFLFLCVFLLYAATLTDILAFIVCVAVILSSMTILDAKIKEKKRQDEDKE